MLNRFSTSRKQATNICAAVAIAIMSTYAIADDCRPYVTKLFDGFPDSSGFPTANYYEVSAVRITARGTAGFTSFSMSPSYSTTQGISNPGTHSLFVIKKDKATDSIKGKFQDVFPGRTDGQADLTTLSIFRSGAVQLRLDDWGGTLVSLGALGCFPGHTGDAFIMRGSKRSDGWGIDMWMFLIVPRFLG